MYESSPGISAEQNETSLEVVVFTPALVGHAVVIGTGRQSGILKSTIPGHLGIGRLKQDAPVAVQDGEMIQFFDEIGIADAKFFVEAILIGRKGRRKSQVAAFHQVFVHHADQNGIGVDATGARKPGYLPRFHHRGGFRRKRARGA